MTTAAYAHPPLALAGKRGRGEARAALPREGGREGPPLMIRRDGLPE